MITFCSLARHFAGCKRGPDIRFDPLEIKTCAFWSYRHGGITLLRLYLQNKTSKEFAFHRNQCKLQISKDYLVWK